MLKKQIDALLEDARFQAWLEAQEDETIVGQANEGCNCPLACYLSALTGKQIRVGYETISLIVPMAEGEEGGEELFITSLPAWAQIFVEYVDCEPIGTVITAQAAKNILEETLGDTGSTADDPDEMLFED